MASPRQIAALMIALTVAGTLLVPIADIVTSNTGTQDVVNETVTAELDTWSDLEGYSVEAGSETVYYPNTSQSDYEVAAASDYDFNNSAGTIKPLSGGNISEGDQLKVSYTYQATGATTTTVVGLVPLFVGLLMLVVIANRVQDGL